MILSKSSYVHRFLSASSECIYDEGSGISTQEIKISDEKEALAGAETASSASFSNKHKSNFVRDLKTRAQVIRGVLHGKDSVDFV